MSAAWTQFGPSSKLRLSQNVGSEKTDRTDGRTDGLAPVRPVCLLAILLVTLKSAKVWSHSHADDDSQQFSTLNSCCVVLLLPLQSLLCEKEKERKRRAFIFNWPDRQTDVEERTSYGRTRPTLVFISLQNGIFLCSVLAFSSSYLRMDESSEIPFPLFGKLLRRSP